MSKTELDELLGVSEDDAKLISKGWASPESELKPGDVWTMWGGLEGVVPLPFRPLHNQVVIRVLADDALVTNVWIPAQARDNRHSAVGLVIAKGVGHRRRKLVVKGERPQWQWLGGYCLMDVEPGDYVVFARFSGERHMIAEESYLLTPIEHVYAVLEGYQTEKAPARETQFSQDAYLDAKHGPSTVRATVVGKHSDRYK